LDADDTATASRERGIVMITLHWWLWSLWCRVVGHDLTIQERGNRFSLSVRMVDIKCGRCGLVTSCLKTDWESALLQAQDGSA
jgi:hypothetical protein